MTGEVQKRLTGESRGRVPTTTLKDSPLVAFALSRFALVFLRDGRGNTNDRAQQDFDRVLGATLTLLGLVIGFSFSFTSSRKQTGAR